MRMFRVLLFSVLIPPFAAVTTAEADAQESSAAGAKQIRQWTRQLDSRRFSERQMAMERLIAAARPAIQPVLQAARDGNLEVAARGVFVLKQLALSESEEIEQEARTALEQLVAGRDSPASRRARASLIELRGVWQQRALDRIREFGAQLTKSHPADFNTLQSAYSVEIGEDWKGGEEGLVHLAALVDLQEIWLEGSQVTDTWLKRIKDLDKLRHVHVRRARITDAGLDHLAEMTSLERLDLWYAPITDAAVGRLQSMKQLQAVSLYGTDVSRQAADSLRETLKGVHVDHRRGAFLGVGCQAHPQGCAVSIVHPGSSANEADVRPGDIIVQYGEKPIVDFTDLTGAIGEHKSGDPVTLKIRRGDETLIKDIRLGEWQFQHRR